MTPQRRLNHAQGYLELGMVAEAAAELARIPVTDQEPDELLKLRAVILQELKDWDGLRTAAAALARRAPTDATAWIMWAYATRRAESLPAAEKILLAAEIHHPGEPTIQFNLGCYACQRGDLVAARQRVERAIALDRKFAANAATDPDLAPLRAAEGTDCQPAP